MTELWDYEKFTPPKNEGGRYFYTYNTGLQNQSVLYSASRWRARRRPLLDPNSFSTDGTVALAGTEPSKDGKLLAYGIAAAGSDWNEWKVRDVATGKDLDDHLKWIKFSAAEWTPDGKGFFYGRFPEPRPGDDLKGANYHQKVYYHRLGTTQADDALVWEDPEHKEWRADATVTDDGKYLILTLGKGTDDKFRVLYRPLAERDSNPVHLVGEFDAEYYVHRQRRPDLLVQDQQERGPRQSGRHRHAFAPARALGRDHARSGRNARTRRCRRRSFPGRPI